MDKLKYPYLVPYSGAGSNPTIIDNQDGSFLDEVQSVILSPYLKYSSALSSIECFPEGLYIVRLAGPCNAPAIVHMGFCLLLAVLFVVI